MPKPLEFTFDDERIFVDRNEAQKQFVDAYNDAKQHEDEYNVICYFGDGGIGKSELFYTLQENLKLNRISSSCDTFLQPVNNKQIPYVTYDLGDSASCDAAQILKRLRNKLNDKQTFRFPLFDLTYVSYLTSRGDGNDLSPIDKVHTFIGTDSWLENTLDFAEGINGFFGLIYPLLSAIEKAKNLPEQFKESKYKKSAKDIIAKIEINEEKPEELKKLLAITFSMDLAWNCKYKLDKPLVIFVDTYETYQNYLNNNPSENDWVKDVIVHSNNTLYVLFGRNQCSYEGAVNYSLNNFDERYTSELMEKKGINDEELITTVYSITGGLPYYISICVSNYCHLKQHNQNPTVDLIGATTSEMNQRYYKYLEDDEKRIVEIASLFDTFSYDDLLECSKSFFGQTFSEEKCKNVMTECIVKKTNDGNNKIHDIAKKVFLENAEKNQHSYYPNMLHIVIKQQLHNLAEFKILADLPQGTMDNCYYNIFKLFEINPNTIDENEIDLIINFTLYYSKLGDKNSKIKEFQLNEKLLEVCKKLFGNEHSTTLGVANNLGSYYSYLGDMNSILKALEINENALEIEKRVYGKEHYNTLITMNNLASIYSLIGDRNNLDKAIVLNKETLDICKRVLGTNHSLTLSSMNNLANCYSKFEDSDSILKAVDLGEEIVTISEKVFGKEHIETLKFRRSLASYYANIRDEEYKLKALNLDAETLEIDKKVLGNEHPDTLDTLSDLAADYALLGGKENVLKAIELDEEALKISKKVLGNDNPRTLDSMSNLANYYAGLGDRKNMLKAIEIGKETLEIRKNIFGDEHPDTIASMMSLGNHYSCLDDDNNLKLEAQIFEKALESSKITFGKSHTTTIVCALALVNTYSKMGYEDNLVKALEVAESTLNNAASANVETNDYIKLLNQKSLEIKQQLEVLQDLANMFKI